jgi:hypothetical protein
MRPFCVRTRTFRKSVLKFCHFLCHSNFSRRPRSGSTGTFFHFRSSTMETLKRLHGSPEKVRFPSNLPMPLETSEEPSHEMCPKSGPISARTIPVFSSGVQPSSVTQHGHRSQPPNQQPNYSLQKLFDKQGKVLPSSCMIPQSDFQSFLNEGNKQPPVSSCVETSRWSVRHPSNPSLPPIPSCPPSLVDLRVPNMPSSVKVPSLAASQYYCCFTTACSKTKSRVSPGTWAYRLIRWVWKVPWI